MPPARHASTATRSRRTCPARPRPGWAAMPATAASWRPRSWPRSRATGRWSDCTPGTRTTASTATRATARPRTSPRCARTGPARNIAGASRRCARPGCGTCSKSPEPASGRRRRPRAASQALSARGLAPNLHGCTCGPAMSRRFVHLTLHSEYSLADSTIRIPDLVKRCVALGQPSVAVTDRNNLFSLVKFFRAAEGAGIKPIAGADISVAEGDEPPATLTLLCRDHGGYLSLSRLLTRAWMEGQRHDGVVVRPQWLREVHGGLFALAGRRSPAGLLVAAGRHDLAEAWVRDWGGVFDDGLHLALARCGFADEVAFNDFALQASSLYSIPVVAGNEVRFIDRDGFNAHEARVCIASGRVLDDPRRPREYTAEQYLKSGQEMAELFADVPDALDNAVALAQRCNLELRLGTYHLPAFPVPSDHTLDSWIRSEARDGLARRLEHAPLAEGHDRASYQARLETEIDVIIGMGFPGYFLIVADFINWAKDHGIPVGPGRGSGAGSLVAWALGITDLDPLPSH